MLAARLTTQRCALVPIRQVSTTALRRSDVKNPVQEFGWKYLNQQRSLGRPIAPHLTIYQPQMTWCLSGAFRFSGCLMSGTLIIGGLGFMLGPWSYTEFIDLFRGVPGFISAPFKFFIAFNVVFYAINGIRMLGFDLGKGTQIATVYKSAYAVLAVSVVLSLAIVLVANSNKNKLQK